MKRKNSDMIFYMITTFIIIIPLLNLVATEHNETELFETFKNKYQRTYRNAKDEEHAFNNFLNNLKIVDELNAKSKSKTRTIYQLNRYGDQDPEEINEHYAIDIKPYSTDLEPEQIKEMKARQKSIEEMRLYDLNKVDDLYVEWIERWGKSNYTKKLDQAIHYYRFIKSVVETNQKKFAGQDVTLGPDADTVREPNEYFYG